MDNSVIYALLNMPITFNSLVIENTSRCNSKCAICYQSASPQGSEQIGCNTLNNELLMQVLRDALSIESLNRRFHLSGGEAFLNFKNALELIDFAKQVGYTDITAVSNGFWAKDIKLGKEFAFKLREAGLTNLEISWDYWHFKYINSKTVSNCIDVCYEYGIETNLRLLATKKHMHYESLSRLRKSSLNKVDRISCCPVFPTGRANVSIPLSEIYVDNNIDGTCHSSLNLTINANGNVYPCCAALDQTENYTFGNINDTKISVIAERMNTSPLLRTILFYGIYAMVPILEEKGIKLNINDFANNCTLCWSIFSNKKYVQIIKEYYQKTTESAISNLTF